VTEGEERGNAEWHSGRNRAAQIHVVILWFFGKTPHRVAMLDLGDYNLNTGFPPVVVLSAFSGEISSGRFSFFGMLSCSLVSLLWFISGGPYDGAQARVRRSGNQ
jgi:hypothetical protein